MYLRMAKQFVGTPDIDVGSGAHATRELQAQAALKSSQQQLREEDVCTFPALSVTVTSIAVGVADPLEYPCWSVTHVHVGMYLDSPCNFHHRPERESPCML